MELITCREVEEILDDWRDIPFFPDYEVNSEYRVRQKSTSEILKEYQWGGKIQVTLKDPETGATRRLDPSILWDMAGCPPSKLARYELKVRPDVVYHNLLADCLQRLGSPEVIAKLPPKEMLQVLKFLESLKENTKKPKSRVASIDAMRRYAQKLGGGGGTDHDDSGDD